VILGLKGHAEERAEEYKWCHRKGCSSTFSDLF